MWKYFGLTKRGGPAEPGGLEEKVDLLVAEVTKLRLAPQAFDLAAASDLPDFTEYVRDHWEDVLARVREHSRPAWTLLKVAAVESAGKATLAIVFPREGEAKGFISSDFATVLWEAMEEVCGAKPPGFTVNFRLPTGDRSPPQSFV
jgi:hypothetical protein